MKRRYRAAGETSGHTRAAGETSGHTRAAGETGGHTRAAGETGGHTTRLLFEVATFYFIHCIAGVFRLHVELGSRGVDHEEYNIAQRHIGKLLLFLLDTTEDFKEHFAFGGPHRVEDRPTAKHGRNDSRSPFFGYPEARAGHINYQLKILFDVEILLMREDLPESPLQFPISLVGEIGGVAGVFHWCGAVVIGGEFVCKNTNLFSIMKIIFLNL